MMFRARETFTTNLEDGLPEVIIFDGRAYSDGDKRIKKVIDRFPAWFEAEADTKPAAR
jgi:hypothetical protein